MGKKSKPSAPDVAGAAKEEGIESRRAQRESLYADRPDQYNPFGGVTWGQESMIDPATGERVTKWTQGQGLSPEMQKQFDRQMGMLGKRGQMSNEAMQRAGQEMGGAPDWARFGEAQGLEFNPEQMRQKAEDAAYGRATSRLDPQFEKRAQEQEIQLRSKGLRPGDQAYDQTMRTFHRSRTDAYEQARMGAVGEGRAESGQLWEQQLGGTREANALRDKKIQEYLDKRKFSLGEAETLDPTRKLGEMQDVYSGGGA